ncbi:unnamed protein product [Kuraishia capsulata CBS 1993]|uniref:Double-strand break repair protein n=1 Tax=Kuraishia capsulata CBS 1993 TaxID=1382522 RepID=W6MSR3_9ASCO|nr:uncharacterized protein KUCA_T00000787001 [Kuraishia capsulata CBS 1993]CDK24820.1 unnamed protein product [Kuraishia capsulata CBS 1993]
MPQVKHIEPGPNTIRLLLTTDNHVGYNETDAIRGDDSWKTFEEIMYVAKDRGVDMVVQGGDLFHINKPSKKSLYHVLRILRSTCYSDKPVELELLSDPLLSMDNRAFNYPNYEDPNINVGIPVFGISGNHDDATGDELLSPMDIISVTGLFNHFGRVVENDSITVSPLLFQKGYTKLALYGMASVRDERLYKTFRDGGVKFTTPDVQQDSWFNMICVHQNHTAHSNTAYLPENFLPSFLDFVLWGHEHQSLPYTTPNVSGGFDVLQAGSSIATSLSVGEADPKYTFILSIKGKDYSLEAIPLKSVRPFVMKEVALSTTGIPATTRAKSDITDYLINEVNKLIEKANNEWKSLNKEDDDEDDDNIGDLETPLPLVRLRVEYSGGYDVENPRRFSNRFVGQVANVNDVVTFYRKRTTDRSLLETKKTTKKISDSASIGIDEDGTVDVSTLVDNFLDDHDLNLLNKAKVGDAIRRFVEKEDKSVLKALIDEEMEQDMKIFIELDMELDGDENNPHGQQLKGSGADTQQSLVATKKGFKQILKQLRNEEDSMGQSMSASSASSVKPAKRKTKSKASSSKFVVSDNSSGDSLSEEDNDDHDVPAKERTPPPRRAKKPVRVVEVLDSDSDMDVDDFDESADDEDFAEAPPAKPSNRRSRKVNGK